MLITFFKDSFLYDIFLKKNLFFLLRISISLLFSFFLSFFIGLILIKYFKKFKIYQKIRIHKILNHSRKNKIPTMGGIIFLISIFLSIIIWTELSYSNVWYILFSCFSFGFIGLIDDFKKIKSEKGLSIKSKYFLQSIIAFIITIIIVYCKNDIKDIKFSFPFFMKEFITNTDIFFYFLLVYLVIVGSCNSVNITDGLDGLAILLVVFVFFNFLVISFISNNKILSCYLNFPYLKSTKEIVVISSIIIGSALSFLWFNSYPAQILMGDIGSLSLGGIIGTIVILLHQELTLIIIGGLFIIETLSVVLQIFFFKLFKKRLFLMTPIHHHYELKGIAESKITIRFWIIGFILMILSFLV